MADLEKEFDEELDLDESFDAESEVDEFDSVPLPGAVESAMSAQPELTTPEAQEVVSGLPKAAEAFGAGLSEVVPGLRSSVAGLAATAGEMTPQEQTPITSYGGKGLLTPKVDQVPMVKGQPVEPIEDYEVIGPEGKSIPVSEAPSTFQEARMEQMRYDEQLFMDNKTASILGAIMGPGVNLSKLAKKSPAMIAKMADKSPKLAKVLETILPNSNRLDQAERLQKTFDRLEQYGKFKKLDKFKSATNKLKAAQAATDALKMGSVAGFAYSEDPFSVQAVKNAAASGLLGSAGTYGFVRGAQGLGWLFSESPGIRYMAKSLEYGKQGEKIDKAMIDEDITGIAKDFIKDYNKALEGAAKSKSVIFDTMQEAGMKLNNRADLEELRKASMAKLSKSEQADAQKFFDFLDDYLQGGDKYRKMMKKLENKITKKIVESDTAEDVAKAKLEKMALKDSIKRGDPIIEVGDIEVDSATSVGGRPEIEAMSKSIDYRTRRGLQSKTYATDIPSYDPTKIEWTRENGKLIATWKDKTTGKTFAEVADIDWDLNPADMSVQETRLMMDKLQNFYDELDMKKSSAAPALKNMILNTKKGLKTKLESLAKEEGFDLPRLDEKIQYLNELKEHQTGFGQHQAFSKTGKMASEETAMSELIKGSPTEKGRITAEEFDKFFNFMQKADPELYNKYLPKIKKYRELNALADPTEQILAASSLKSVLGPILGAGIKGSAAAGRGIKYGKGVGAKIAGMKPDSIGKLRTALLAKRDPDTLEIIKTLDKAKNASSDQQRQRIMYGLYSSPAFRKLIGISAEDQKE